jgi:hypothetical protein
MKKMVKMLIILLSTMIILIIIKAGWVAYATGGQGLFENEKKDVIYRANYLISKVAISPQQLLNEMPSGIGKQFQGEWALYTCSMTCAALTNIAILYPQNRDLSIRIISDIIEIAMSSDLREYDYIRWGEDPLEGIAGELSHISYYSHLAWMISGYKQIGGDSKYDDIYHSLCKAMNRRIRQSPNMNIPTYPGESIYLPDMLVAIVALANYSRQNHDEFTATVKMWVEKAKTEWIDRNTGLLVSFLPDDDLLKGSYSALNCYYLTFIDDSFAKDQYNKLKKFFLQTWPVMGFKEYYDRSCWLGMDIDAGPVIINLSSSGTAFAIGPATYFNDTKVRKGLLRTAEIAGTTVTWFGKSHYLLANIALVGEAILLAMRTTTKWV